jgi:hypothetical protein
MGLECGGLLGSSLCRIADMRSCIFILAGSIKRVISLRRPSAGSRRG